MNFSRNHWLVALFAILTFLSCINDLNFVGAFFGILTFIQMLETSEVSGSMRKNHEEEIDRPTDNQLPTGPRNRKLGY